MNEEGSITADCPRPINFPHQVVPLLLAEQDVEAMVSYICPN